MRRRRPAAITEVVRQIDEAPPRSRFSVGDVVGIIGVVLAICSAALAQWNQVGNSVDMAKALNSMSAIARSMSAERDAMVAQANATKSASEATAKSAAATERASDASFKVADASRLQADASSGANVISQDAMQREMRAYLSATPGVLKPLALDQYPSAATNLENGGRTPAQDETWLSGFDIVMDPSEAGIVWETCSDLMRDPSAHRQMISKTAAVDKSAPWRMSKDLLDGFNEGRLVLVHTGRICYHDIFGSIHSTDFCHYWKNNAGTYQAGYCRKGNSAD